MAAQLDSINLDKNVREKKKSWLQCAGGVGALHVLELNSIE